MRSPSSTSGPQAPQAAHTLQAGGCFTFGEGFRAEPVHGEQWAGQPGLAVPARTRLLGSDPACLQHVAGAVQHVHEEVLAPYWPQIRRPARTDRSQRHSQFTEDGLEALLNGLNPG